MKTVLFVLGIIAVVFGHTQGYTETSLQNGKEYYVAAKAPSLSIDPKFRALDYLHVFEAIRKEKPANKVCIQLMNGLTLTNIIDMQVMPNNTMFMFRFNTPQGIKLQAIELELVQSIGYLE